MVLEDDAFFEPFFAEYLSDMLADLAAVNLRWDLIYLGRKRMGNAEDEQWVPGE